MWHFRVRFGGNERGFHEVLGLVFEVWGQQFEAFWLPFELSELVSEFESTSHVD